MNINAVIPVKSLTHGKTRLAGFLDDDARTDLNVQLLDHALDLAAVFPGISNTIVVSADDRVLSVARARGAVALPENGGGLNPALTQAMSVARNNKARSILVLPTDLPIATAEDLLALATTGHDMAIAADRRGVGTNALCVPTTEDFTFHFGEGSFVAHMEEAQISGLSAHILHRPNLGFDIDTPEDYRRWKAMV